MTKTSQLAKSNNGKRIGYIRVSTVEQNEGRQVKAMEELKVDKVFTEKKSGKNTDRPQLQAMIDFVREGDTLYIESFSRLARDTKDLLNLLEVLSNKGVGVVSLKERIDTTTASGKLMVTLFGAVATFERDIMLERQREGVALAKAQGKYKGRKAKELPDNFKDLYNDYMIRKITKGKLAELCNMSRATLDVKIANYDNNKL